MRALTAQSVKVEEQSEPKGYIATEIGLIPNDWELTTLGQFVGLRRGHDLTERARRKGDVPVMGSAGQNGYHDRAIVKGPGVLLGRSGASFGVAHYCCGDFWPHNTALYVTDFFGHDPLFSFYFLKSIDFSRHNSGGAQQSLNRNFIAPIRIAIPKISEQQAIAEALSDADALIESLEQLIAKKCAIKQGAMQKLLTGKRRLPGFKGEWGSTTLAECSAFITKGSTPTTYGFSWEQSGTLFLRSECVSPRGLNLSESMFISPVAHSMLRRSEVVGGDILMTITGNVGRVVQLPVGFASSNINQHIARIRITAPQMLSTFIAFVLNQDSYRKYYTSILTGQAYPQISLKQVRETRIPVPILDEQTAIADTLIDMNAALEALDAKLAKARAVKQGMMQQLLAGRVRLA